jgi:hypothetical protein
MNSIIPVGIPSTSTWGRSVTSIPFGTQSDVNLNQLHILDPTHFPNPNIDFSGTHGGSNTYYNGLLNPTYNFAPSMRRLCRKHTP